MPTYEITVRRDISAFDTVLVDAFNEALARRKVDSLHRRGSLSSSGQPPALGNHKSISCDYQITNVSRVITQNVTPKHIDLLV